MYIYEAVDESVSCFYCCQPAALTGVLKYTCVYEAVDESVSYDLVTSIASVLTRVFKYVYEATDKLV